MAKNSESPSFPVAPRDFPDRAFQTVLKHPENLQELVQVAAPQQAPLLDCLNAEFRDPRFYMDDWRRLAADLLFNVPIIGAPPESKARLAVVLVEQQTAAEDAAIFRTSFYQHLAWADDWKEWEGRHERGDKLRLKPTIPIILHTGATPWNAAREFRQLFEGPDILLAPTHIWRPMIWEVSQHTPQELLNMTGAWLKTLAVVRAEKEPFSLFSGVFKETFGRLNPLAESSHVRWSDLVKFVVSWALNRRAKEEREPLAELAIKSQRSADQRNEVQTMSQTIAESLIEEGEIKGEIKGETKARRADLQRLLKRRFSNKFDEAAAARIQTTEDLAVLESWLDAFADAQSWSDFRELAGWSSPPNSDDESESA